jgi:hypothetical protein
MLQNAISGVKRLCLEQNGEHFQHIHSALFNKINITIVILLLIPRILNSPFSVLQLSLNVTFVAIVQNSYLDSSSANFNNKFNGSHDISK